MISNIKILMNLRKALENETVSHVGFPAPVTIQQDQPVRRAVERMKRRRVGCILILSGESLVGIFTERDLITRVLGQRGTMDLAVSELMTPKPEVARTDEPIKVVLSRFMQKGMRHLPVLDSADRPVGTLSVRRAVHFLSDHTSDTLYNLPPTHNQVPTARGGG